LNAKLKTAFGQDKISGALTNKINASFDGSKITFNTTQGHSFTMADVSADAPFLKNFGITSGASSDFDLNQKIGEIFDFGPNATDMDIVLNDVKINLTSSMTVSEMMSKINESGAGVSLSYDKAAQAFTLESSKTGQVNAIRFGENGGIGGDDITSTNVDSDNTLEFLSEGLGLFSFRQADETSGSISYPAGSIIRDQKNIAQDAIYTYNGVTTSRESNTVTITDGISLTFSELTIDGEDNDAPEDYATITVSQNTDKALENIKKFVEAYNTLIADINGRVNTARPKSDKYTYYEPLLDEEKEEMSESQIEKWETKAKTGILHRDSILSDITRQMRTWLYEPVVLEDGRKISMYEIGITTSSNTKDAGKLIIDEDKLKKAIAERGNDIVQLFTKGSSNTDKNEKMKEEGLVERLLDITNKNLSSGGPIALKAGVKDTWTETNNSLYKELTANSQKIDDMIEKLTKKEEYYYSMFARMEQAMGQANSQASYLQQALMG
jgi:flagellar hook-associated protein 2